MKALYSGVAFFMTMSLKWNRTSLFFQVLQVLLWAGFAQAHFEGACHSVTKTPPLVDTRYNTSYVKWILDLIGYVMLHRIFLDLIGYTIVHRMKSSNKLTTAEDPGFWSYSQGKCTQYNAHIEEWMLVIQMSLAQQPTSMTIWATAKGQVAA